MKHFRKQKTREIVEENPHEKNATAVNPLWAVLTRLELCHFSSVAQSQSPVATVRDKRGEVTFTLPSPDNPDNKEDARKTCTTLG